MARAADKPVILVVDDSRVVRHAINKILGPEFSILEAGDGVSGWHSAEKHPNVGLVISDIQMPELDGYGMICKIRAADDPSLREVPIIVITGADDETTRERAYACGANDFIQKPFNASQLLDCVRTHLSDHGTRTAELAAQFSGAVESIVVADSGAGNIREALEQFVSAINILNGSKPEALAPELPHLVLRFLPLLKHSNKVYRLGLDKELSTLEQKIASLHPARGGGQRPS